MEIERKFLVKELPELLDCANKKITQAYISTDPVIRIRKMDNAYALTVKSHGSMVREEFELPITQEQYESLWNKIDYSPIEKVRYFIPLSGGLVAELDIYHGHLEGLMTVEVEFSSKSQAQNFEVPSWFGEDITLDNRYKNNNLSIYGAP